MWKFSIIKMKILHKLLSGAKAISIKMPADVDGETDKLLLKLICKCKELKIAK